MTERTLLLVDDDENVVASLVRLLRRDGYRILRANSGKEGFEMLASNKVGVIISDQRMPEMTGVEFLSKVKESYPDTVRIVLSGYTELDSVTEAINRGSIYRFFTKPWDDDLLRANVEEAFHRHEMSLENIRLSQELRAANDELLRLNHLLEHRLEEKSHEALLSLDGLLITQEVLENLPVAVICIGDDGIIAIANKFAQQLFGAKGTCPVLGEESIGLIPEELLIYPSLSDSSQNNWKTSHLKDGRNIRYWISIMGEFTRSKGIVLVIDPVL